MLITQSIKDIFQEIENHQYIDTTLNTLIISLIRELHTNSLKLENQNFYRTYLHKTHTISKYPLDEDGYGKSFDPLENESEFLTTFRDYNMVIGKSVVKDEICEAAITHIKNILLNISENNFILEDSNTYKSLPHDNNNIPLISRGFFELYHDKTLADIRQSLRLYIHHVVILGNVKLWTSFDRLGIKLPNHYSESLGLNLHVDQNPNVHPDFQTLQGILALVDCPIERGTFLGVPGSVKYFKDYNKMTINNGEYVELNKIDPTGIELYKNIQPIPLRKGDIVTRDSRMTHANTTNTSNKVRMVGMVAAGFAKEDNQSIVETRLSAYHSGIGSNVREALMHATQKPRYNTEEINRKLRIKEDFTVLGELLYGLKKYKEIL